MAGPANVSTLLLRNVPLFSVLPENQLAVLTGVVSRKSFPKGTVIIAAGDPTESLFVVISGRMKVMMSDDEGREVILAILIGNRRRAEIAVDHRDQRGAKLGVEEIADHEQIGLGAGQSLRPLSPQALRHPAIRIAVHRRRCPISNKVGRINFACRHEFKGTPTKKSDKIQLIVIKL